MTIDLIRKDHFNKEGELIYFFEKLDKSLNSRLYNISYKGNLSILKLFRSDDDIRFFREKESLLILNKNAFKYCPKLYYSNNDLKYLILEKLQGDHPISNYKFKYDLAIYLNDLQSYIPKNKKLNFHNASEAAFSLAEHSNIVLNKAKHTLNKIKVFPSASKVTKLIKDKIIPSLEAYKKSFSNDERSYIEIHHSEKIFSPSDIGSHNTFNYKDQLYTFDYEYAGLDDPAKTMFDLLMHPDQFLLLDEYKKLMGDLKNIDIFKNCIERFKKIMNIYKYKWFLIILNGFLKNISDDNVNLKTFDKALNYLVRCEKIIEYLKTI